MAPKIAKRDEGLWDLGKPSFCNQRTQPLEVMCLGLSRTGTTSMLEALSVLGYGTTYNSRETLRRSQEAFCGLAFDAKFGGRGPPFAREQFESLFGDYRAVSGEFVAAFAAELIALYPDAKVILTIRDSEEAWFRSLSDTMWYGHQLWTSWLVRKLHARHRQAHLFTRPWWEYMFRDDFETHGIRVYREHNAMVQRLVPADRLLVYNVKEGWGPLCRFLEKDVPEQEFPHTNRTWEHRNIFATGRRKHLQAWFGQAFLRGVLPAIVVLALWMKRVSVRETMKNLGM